MANAIDVVTLAEARDAVNLAAGDTSQDTELAVYVTAISVALEAVVGSIVQRTITGELHDGTPTSRRYARAIEPRETPVASITSFTEYNNTTAQVLAQETNTTKTANDFLLDSDGRHSVYLRRRSNGGDAAYPVGRQNLTVTYVTGRFATTAVVDSLFKIGAALMLQNLWRHQEGLITFATITEPGPRVEGRPPGFAVPYAVLELLADEKITPGLA